MSTEAVSISEIEAEVLDQTSVQLCVQRQLGLSVDQRRVRPKERGAAEGFVALNRSSQEPLREEALLEPAGRS